ncbi:MAG: hypothetical protein RJB38_1515 [Pseudomonadota bacterium]|jgi:hypothetical protein
MPPEHLISRSNPLHRFARLSKRFSLFSSAQKLLLATALEIFTLQANAHAGALRDCLTFFGLPQPPFFSAKPVSIEEPGVRSQISVWLERPAENTSRKPKIPRNQELIVRGRPGFASSESEQAALRKTFLETATRLEKGAADGTWLGGPETYFETLLQHMRSASEFLESQGVDHVLRVPSKPAPKNPRLELVIAAGEKRPLSQLARGLHRLHPNLELIYDPHLNWREGFLGAFTTNGSSGRPPQIHTSSESILDGIQAGVTLRHEIQHAYYHHLESQRPAARWILGSFAQSHKSLYRSPFSGPYSDSFSFEELATQGQDLMVLLYQLARTEAPRLLSKELFNKVAVFDRLGSRLGLMSDAVQGAIGDLQALQKPSLSSPFRTQSKNREYRVQIYRILESPYESVYFEFTEVLSGSRILEPGEHKAPLPVGFSISISVLDTTLDPRDIITKVHERMAELRSVSNKAKRFSEQVKHALIGKDFKFEPNQPLSPQAIEKVQELLKTATSPRNY